MTQLNEKVLTASDRIAAAFNATLIELAPTIRKRFDLTRNEMLAAIGRACVANTAACTCALIYDGEQLEKAGELADEIAAAVREWIDQN